MRRKIFGMKTISPRSDIASVNVRAVVLALNTDSDVNVPSTRDSEWRRIFPATTTPSRRRSGHSLGSFPGRADLVPARARPRQPHGPGVVHCGGGGWTPAAGIVRGARQLGRAGKGTPPAPASQNQ